MDSVVEAGEVSPRRAATDEPLQQLYREHRLGLVRLGVLLLGEQAPAEDVVQDVFAAMWRRKNLPATEPAAYLRQAVVNRCRTHLRRRMLARSRHLPADTPSAGPADVAELADEHRTVLAALDHVPTRQREVLVLRYFSDLSVADVASTLGISEGTVKSQAARGLDKLRTLLEKESAR